MMRKVENRKSRIEISKFYYIQPSAHYLLLLTAYCLLAFFLCSCTPHKEKIYRKSKIMMDTFVSITVVSDSKAQAEKAIDAALYEIERLEKLTNFFSKNSELTLINKNAGISEVKISTDILNILDKALFVSKNTDGEFDVTIGPVSALYDFYKKIKPEDSEIKKKLSLVNYKDLIIDKKKSTAFLRKKGMLIDLGGIAKGYAADKAEETLKKNRIRSGLISIAGDIKAFGLKPDKSPWKVGIRNPRAEGKEDDVMTVIELSDMAISTSGDYQRFFMLDGKRYHHLLSPKTGYPAGRCRSASVIAKEGAFTDAFATGVFILRPEKGMKVLEKMGFEGLIVDNQGRAYKTKGFKEKV
jgi:FAD:protein FMN transferase